MNAPLNSDSQLYSSEAGTPVSSSGYSPSVPISVYRELATELKTTQTTLDALTQQNQQLLRQNKLLRTEIHRFVQAAEQLGHFAGVVPQEPPSTPPDMISSGRLQEQSAQPEFLSHPFTEPEPTALQRPTASQRTAAVPQREAPTPERPPSPYSEHQTEELSRPPERPRAKQQSAIVPHPKAKKRDRPRPKSADPNGHRLFTEQPEGLRPLSKVASRSDLGNLWLATTILLVVVSAFGAGFLIMRPLLNR